MTAMVAIAAVLLAISAGCAVFRVARGPSILDRVLAVDVLLAVIGGGLVLDMVLNRHLNHLVLLIVLSVVGFVGSVTVARFVTDRR